MSKRNDPDISEQMSICQITNLLDDQENTVGNPLVKERVETANELSRYLALQCKLIE